MTTQQLLLNRGSGGYLLELKRDLLVQLPRYLPLLLSCINLESNQFHIPEKTSFLGILLRFTSPFDLCIYTFVSNLLCISLYSTSPIKIANMVIITITGKLKRLIMNDFYYGIFTYLDTFRSMDKSNYSFKLNQGETSSTLYERSRPPPLNLGPKRSIS